jgi:ATP-binding cassette, subfamily B, multidrug efflux pump
MTVRGNVAFGRSESPLDDVRNAARGARFDDEVMAFPAAYDTLVGERGVTLSGGQRQRGTLARALLVEPDILVLDDAFSSVDAQTEAAILSELRELRRGRTTLIVSQRISTVRHADWVIVLENGRVTEQGTPAALEKNGGLYARLHEQQKLQAELESLE